MALIINQGIQDTSKDTREFPIIVENDIKLEIVEITLSKFLANSLSIKLRILNGAHKNQTIFDSVNYDSKSPMSWKYRSLRACAGVPYKEGEPANIDIEKLLLNKVVTADLSARAGKDKEGNTRDYQNIKYKKATLDTKATINTDDFPFNVAAATVAPEQSADKPTDVYDDSEWD